MTRGHRSWGRLPHPPEAATLPVYWRTDPLPSVEGLSMLPFGRGRSYGDSCLNSGQALLETRWLDHYIAFDPERGILECEAGVTIGDLLAFGVPRGWFPRVTPGTKAVTVGGAIANDVHGKNHHRAGSFGSHVLGLRLLRSDGAAVSCSPDENAELFAGTVGGLGLTGLIQSARLMLGRIPGPFLVTERMPVADLDELLAASDDAASRFEHTVAWIDVSSRGAIGRGVLLGGDHAEVKPPLRRSTSRGSRVTVPFTMPELVLNRSSMRAFHALYRWRETRRVGPTVEHYEPFFYPLDAVGHWNRLYGRRGFYQYQCVVPNVSRPAVRELLSTVRASDELPFLAILKVFGDIPSRGMLSFARPGPTLALDFPDRGEATLRLFRRLDDIVLAAGGAIYPAKDARMSGEAFRHSFPRWPEFANLVDPGFSSSFWRRVSG